jgi:hypothetical protein
LPVRSILLLGRLFLPSTQLGKYPHLRQEAPALVDTKQYGVYFVVTTHMTHFLNLHQFTEIFREKTSSFCQDSSKQGKPLFPSVACKLPNLSPSMPPPSGLVPVNATIQSRYLLFSQPTEILANCRPECPSSSSKSTPRSRLPQ